MAPGCPALPRGARQTAAFCAVFRVVGGGGWQGVREPPEHKAVALLLREAVLGGQRVKDRARALWAARHFPVCFRL